MTLIIKRGLYFLIAIWFVLCISSCSQNLSDGGNYKIEKLPTSPSSLVATPQGRFNVNLSWSDNSDSEDGFKIERKKASDSSPYAEMGTVGADVSSYTDSGLISNTAYSYRVRAYNSAADSDYSNEATVTTAPFTIQFGTSDYDFADDVARDSAGNLYVVGYTRGSFSGFTNKGGRDIFLVKYNSLGLWQWTSQIGTSDYEEATGVAVDRDGNIYITGWALGDLDGDGPNKYAGVGDIFLIKYDSLGNQIWIKEIGTPSDDLAHDLAIDSNLNVYVTGYTEGSFAGIGPCIGPCTNVGGKDLFLLKYDSLGNLQWINQMGTSGDDRGRGVGVNSTGGAIYVTGHTTGSLGDGYTNPNTLTFDLFLIRFDSGGNKVWAGQMGTWFDDIATDINVDSVGNFIHICGYTGGALDGQTSAGGYDFFLVKYDSTGYREWTRQRGTATADGAYGVAVDNDGYIYVTGDTEDRLDGNNYSGLDDVFLVKYDSNGIYQWTDQLGTEFNEGGTGIAVDGTGNIYVSGYTEGSIDGNTNAGSSDFFLAKFNSLGVKF